MTRRGSGAAVWVSRADAGRGNEAEAEAEAEQMQKRNQEQHQKENERRGTKLQVMQASSSGLLGANESGVGPEWVKNPPGLNLVYRSPVFSAEGQSALVK